MVMQPTTPIARAESVRHLTLRPGVELRREGSAWVSDPIAAGIAWTELVPSWEIEGDGQSELMVEVGGRWYSLGKWGDGKTSVNGQRGDGVNVYTDTLVVRQPGPSVRLRLETRKGAPELRWLQLSFSAGVPAFAPFSGRPIAPLDVPIRAQGDYPNGGVLCSPTSVSMTLWYWANLLNRPGLDSDVPEVQAGVFDPAWGGTGNWTFNAAFASDKPGMVGKVARLRDTDDLEAWLRAGVPVITSVSYDLLKGKDKKGENDGHLVVVVGVDAEGRYIFNDPGRKPIRLVYERDAFLRAWASSRNTVYLIFPRRWITPALP